MSTIKNLLNRVEKVDLRSEVPIIIERTSDTIIDLNQAQLYQEGVNKKSEKLKPYANENYALAKSRMNPNLNGDTDLFLTGEFYSKFFVEAKPKEFIIDSEDSKTSDLKKKYGVTLFGLTNESRKIYSLGMFFNGVKQYITLITGLTFKK